MNKSLYPKISVVTPSYNQGEYLEKTILSVLDQNYPNLEYIIMDGGSTDNSVEIIKKYSDKLTYWQSRPDGGQSAAINEGFRHATGDIFCWLNSDDKFKSNALFIVSDFFMKNPSHLWLMGGIEIINNKNKGCATKIIPKKLDFDTITSYEYRITLQPATFWISGLWRESGGLKEDLNCAMDLDLFIKFSKIAEGKVLEEYLAEFLVHPKSKTTYNDYEVLIETALVLCSHGNFKEGKQALMPPLKRFFELQHKFEPILSNRIYKMFRNVIKRK